MASLDEYKDWLRRIRRSCGFANSSLLVIVLGARALNMSTHLLMTAWFLVVIEIVVENSIRPYWKWVASSQPEAMELATRQRDLGIAGVTFLKVGISVILLVSIIVNYGLHDGMCKLLLCVAISIIFLEGFSQALLVTEELVELIKHPISKFWEIQEFMGKGLDWGAVNFLGPSVANAMLCVTGLNLLSGDLGSKLSETTWWTFFGILLVDICAEAMYRFSCFHRSGSYFDLKLGPLSIIATLVFRMMLEGMLSNMLLNQLHQNSFMDSNGSSNAAWTPRIKSLLTVFLALSIFQAMSFLSRVLSFAWCYYIPYALFCTILFLACALYLVNWFVAKAFIFFIKTFPIPFLLKIYKALRYIYGKIAMWF